MLKLVAFALLIGVANGAAACLCRQNPDIPQALNQSDFVADGIVTAIESQRVGWRKLKVSLLDRFPWIFWRLGLSLPSSYDDGFAIHLTIQQVWKGNSASKTVIYTSQDESACGFPFRVGNRYIVYSNAMPQGHYETSLCSRTTTWNNNEASELNDLANEKTF